MSQIRLPRANAGSKKGLIDRRNEEGTDDGNLGDIWRYAHGGIQTPHVDKETRKRTDLPLDDLLRLGGGLMDRTAQNTMRQPSAREGTSNAKQLTNGGTRQTNGGRSPGESKESWKMTHSPLPEPRSLDPDDLLEKGENAPGFQARLSYSNTGYSDVQSAPDASKLDWNEILRRRREWRNRVGNAVRRNLKEPDDSSEPQ